MGQIVLLDEHTVNQIAAGEVVERPASVVKEMVENSIDAGANNIKIEIRNGGIAYIRITDNGKGIEEDDIELAFEAHATSKIRQADDLKSVRTMGFRGEALASIAAISNVEVISKTESAPYGTKVVVEAGKIISKQEVGAPKGTTIAVSNLFFNTPVRYKFLKRDFTEAGYIEDAVTRLALSNPNIAFTLISNNKTVLQTPGDGKLKTVIYNIYGKDVANSLVNVDTTYENFRITGVCGKPEIARSNRSNQVFFINGRFVKDKTLSAGTDEAYRTLIPNGKFGFVVLNLQMEPEQVDVNVHPAKLEVRFENEQEVFKAIYHAIKGALLGDDLVPGSSKEDKNETEPQKSNVPHFQKQERPSMFNSFKKLMNKRNKEDEEVIEEKQEKAEKPEENAVNLEDTIKVETLNLEVNQNKLEGTKLENSSLNEVQKVVTPVEEKPKYQTPEEVEANLRNKIEMLTEIAKSLTDTDVKKEELNKEEINKEIMNTDILTEKTQSIEQNNKPELAQKIEESDKILENNIEIKTEEKADENDKVLENNTETKVEEKTEVKVEEKPSFDNMYSKLFGVSKEKEEKQEVYPDVEKCENISVFDDKEVYDPEIEYKYVGIAFNTYIIIQLEDGIYLIDQHAAHERIMYEKIKKNFYSTNNQSQMMLLPDIITLTNKDMLIVKENIDLFEKAGFTLEEFGDNTIKLNGVPDVCMELDTKELFIDLIDGVDLSIRTTSKEKEEKFIATVACKAAVKAKMVLKTEEVEALLKELLKLPNPFTCPHGRPTAIKMTKDELDKKFARK